MHTSFFARAVRTAALYTLLFFGFYTQAFAGNYTTSGGKIYDGNGQEVQIRGINHFGFNAVILQPQFLWSMGWKDQLAQIKSLGFNAVRVPYVPDTLYNTTPIDQLSYIDPNKNPEFIGKTALQALDLWMAEANRLGLHILLDFHSVSAVRQYPTWFVSNPADFSLMYNKQAYTAANWRRDLVFVAQRYAALQYFMGIDIYNEPNGQVRWSTGDANMTDANYYWKAAAESAASAILAANPNLLIFVQGITGNWDNVENSQIPMNWGENFQPQRYQPLNIPLNKLVLSPHTYGPDVYVKSSFSATNYPANLAADWEKLFGQFYQVHAVVPGEWGGRYGSGPTGAQDKAWQDAFVDYFLSKGMRNSFYWCYTPNSGDTGGILDDNLNVRTDKLALLQKLWGGAATPQPTPTPTPTPTPPPPTPTPTPPPPSASLTISSFAPLSGPAGTVVTINGVGMTGVNLAWVGADHNAPVHVVSDTQVQVTISAGATDGAIGIFTPTQTSFTPQWFTITAGTAPTPTPPPPTPTPTPPPPTAPLPEPMISNFSPTSGAPGTIVTINGTGFNGINQAWVGAAHDAGVKVISDTQVQVTVPSSATTGAIGILNPSHASFTPTSFTVTAPVAVYPQPMISSFSPTSGRPGTVVNIYGTGFTSINQAWVGTAHNATVRVLSDTQVQVTVPAGATTGAIGILNPKHASFTATSFRMK